MPDWSVCTLPALPAAHPPLNRQMCLLRFEALFYFPCRIELIGLTNLLEKNWNLSEDVDMLCCCIRSEEFERHRCSPDIFWAHPCSTFLWFAITTATRIPTICFFRRWHHQLSHLVPHNPRSARIAFPILIPKTNSLGYSCLGSATQRHYVSRYPKQQVWY